MGKKKVCSMVNSPLPTAETIDLLVKTLALWHICIYRVDIIPPLNTFCSPLTVLCHGNFQAGNKSFFWTDPNDTLWIRKAKGTESSLAKVLLSSDQSLISATLPISQIACMAGFLHVFLLYTIGLSTTLLEIKCFLLLNSNQFKDKLKNYPYDQF